MTITREWIGEHATGPNQTGWTRLQCEALGVEWPLVKGWRSKLIGTQISDERARAFEQLGEARRRKLTRHEVQNDLEW